MTMRSAAALSIALALIAAGCASQTATPTPTTPVASPSPATSSGPRATATTPPPTPRPLPQGSGPVELAPADFSTTIDNPYWPIISGSKWVYRETDAEGTELRIEVTVTGESRTIIGIQAVVVHDVVTEDGDVVEDTFDWYAQDSAGNVWYLGEDTKEYEGGEVISTEGSWEAGVDGAQPGVIVPAEPRVGLAYRQEYLAGEAEDSARVLSVDERAEVPFGKFQDVLMTRESTPLSPEIIEYKFYAKGVGMVLVLTGSGGADREELLTYTR